MTVPDDALRAAVTESVTASATLSAFFSVTETVAEPVLSNVTAVAVGSVGLVPSGDALGPVMVIVCEPA